MQVDPHHEPVPRPASNQHFQVEAFNPLLRSLLSWGLVRRVQTDDGARQWELTEEAQQRLDELTPERQRATETLAYLDHSCSSCRQQRLTHLVDGHFLCAECQRLEAEGTPPQVAGTGHKHRPRLLHRD
jgi:ribosomal protein L37AE/L43A